MTRRIKVTLAGFGQIGRMLYRKWSGSPLLEVVGVADPLYAGQSADTLADVSGKGIVIGKQPAPGAEVAVIASGSRMKEVLPVAEQCVEMGMNVVTTCEGMFFDRSAEVRHLGELAAKRQCAVLAGGINPGFLMDYLPLVLSGASMNIRSVKVERYQDASFRRTRFQKKIGCGLTVKAFEEALQEGKLCHIGLKQSAEFLASALGWIVGEMVETCRPVTSDGNFVSGIHQILTVTDENRKEIIRLDFLAAAGGVESCDRIVIDGEPRIESVISGGLPGDAGTCAVMTSLVRKIASCGKTGLLTLQDLSPFAGHI